MTAPFTVGVDRLGNLWMQSGKVIAFHATTTDFTIGTGGRVLARAGLEDDFTAATGGGASFEGGSGNNLRATTATPFPGTMVPDGKFTPTGPDEWRSQALFEMAFDPGDGSAEISDGTNIVATLPAGPATVAPYGTFTATAYGETTYNSGAPWTVDLEYEGAAPWPNTAARVRADDTTITVDSYPRTGWSTWASGGWTITLDGTGAGELDDGTDIVATRAAQAGRIFDPTSYEWASTVYGAATYGEVLTVTAGTRSAGTFTEQAWTLIDTAGTVETWVGETDATLFIELDTATGDALLKDEFDTVGERLGGSMADPDGAYTATAYGEDTFNASAAWTYTLATGPEGRAFTVQISLDRAYPAAGYLWVELTLDGADEVTAADGPFWGPSLPANSSVLAVVPICHSDGAGLVEQIQLGPIYWRPNP